MKHITEFKVFESLGTYTPVGPVAQYVIDILRNSGVRFTDASTKVQQKNATVNLIVECAPKDLYKIITSVELRDKFNSDELLKKRVSLVTKLDPSIWTATMADRKRGGVNFFIYEKSGRMTFGYNNNPDASTALKYTKEDDPKEVTANIFTKFINRNIYQVFYRVIDHIREAPAISDELVDEIIKARFNYWNKILLVTPALTIKQFNKVFKAVCGNKDNDFAISRALQEINRTEEIEKKTVYSILTKDMPYTIAELIEKGIGIDVSSLLILTKNKNESVVRAAHNRLKETDVLGDLLGE